MIFKPFIQPTVAGMAKRASQILIAGPEGQEKFAGLEMKLSYLSI